MAAPGKSPPRKKQKLNNGGVRIFIGISKHPYRKTGTTSNQQRRKKPSLDSQQRPEGRDLKNWRLSSPSKYADFHKSLVAAKVNDLQWRETSPPGHLDDYEGFFGLEEVEDVTVLRDPATGQVSFHQKQTSPSARKASAPSNGHPDGNDEWLGFSDDSESDSDDSAAFGNGHGNPFEMLAEDSRPCADVEDWRKLNCLSDETLESIATLNFSHPTPIQASALPLIIDGRDLIGKAPTGSGKTLAFGIPIFEQWLLSQQTSNELDKSPRPLALIIEPARELAHQIEAHLSALRSLSGARPVIATLTGGLSSQKQKRLLERADIVIATPGRLWDIMSEDKQTLQAFRGVGALIIDEADRLLSHGHFQELEQILNALDRTDENESDHEHQSTNRHKQSARQTLVFSATFAKELQHKLGKISKHEFSKERNSMGYLLQKLNFRQQPRFIDINPDAQMATNLTEALLEVSDMNKDLYLYALLLMFQPLSSIRALVFVNSISAVRRIVPFLHLLGFNALALHSNMEQKTRLKTIERFTSSATSATAAKPAKPAQTSSSILVATDVAARGLDLPEVHVVIHYHLPRTADMYIHRSGRTARASASGASILMAGTKEAAGVRRLISQVHAEKPKRSKRELRIVTVEDRIVGQLRPRAQLAKKIADVEQAKEKSSGGDKLFQQAADDLGVDMDGIEQLADAKGPGARGKKRKEKEAEAQTVTKAELKGAKMELKSLLSQRIKMGGVSEKYLANGNVDMGALMRENGDANVHGLFLGNVEGLRLL